MKKIWLLIFIVGLCFIEKGYCLQSLDLNNSIFECGYNAGKFISIRDDYVNLGLFTPFIVAESWEPFVDLHAYRFNNGKWASSLGGGIRKVLPNDSIVGLNAYYDYRRVHKLNFHQAAFGFELLNPCWDARINCYLPVGRRTQSCCISIFDKYGDGFEASRRKTAFVYSGFDAEVGIPVFQKCDFNVYIAGGPYYYTRSNNSREFWGAFGRIEFNFRTYLSLQARVSYDHVYSTNVQGIFQLQIPFNLCDLCGIYCECRNLFMQKVRRNNIIQTDSCCDWIWNWDDRK